MQRQKELKKDRRKFLFDIESLEENINKYQNEYTFLTTFIEEFLSNVNKFLSDEIVSLLFAIGRPGLKKGALVTLDRNLNLIFYTGFGTSIDSCIGIIHEVVKPGLYLVESPKYWNKYLEGKFPISG